MLVFCCFHTVKLFFSFRWPYLLIRRFFANLVSGDSLFLYIIRLKRDSQLKTSLHSLKFAPTMERKLYTHRSPSIGSWHTLFNVILHSSYELQSTPLLVMWSSSTMSLQDLIARSNVWIMVVVFRTTTKRVRNWIMGVSWTVRVKLRNRLIWWADLVILITAQEEM